MMKLNYSRILSVLLISFSLLSNSCSVVGYKLGSKADSSIRHREIINPGEFSTIKRNSKIIIHLYDNTSIGGKFDKVSKEHLILKYFGDIERVKIDEIQSIEVKSIGSTNYKWSGLIIGAGLDFGILFSIFVFIATDT